MSKKRPTNDPSSGAGPERDELDTDTDTEGHSYMNAELGRQVIRDHARDAAEYERKSALSRQARPRRGLRDRLLGR
jgi:hypothetical protein